jgi:hypothetical protein
MARAFPPHFSARPTPRGAARAGLSAWSFALCAASAVSLGACGAKTGIDVPDLGPDLGPDISLPCLEVPLDPDGGAPIELPIEIESRLERADVVFLIDVTASMGAEIEAVRRGLRDRIAPTIYARVPDTEFAVATFGDYPVSPFGSPGDNPYELFLPMTSDLARVQAAMNTITLGSGGDGPESQVEALYQVATGEGRSGFYTDPSGRRVFAEWVPPSLGCPRGGFGYPCFREDALPIVFLFTDNDFHNGPGGSEPYLPVLSGTTPATYEQAVAALRERGIRVVGFWSGGDRISRDVLRVATDTEAVARDGSPLVFNIGANGERLDERVVEAIQDFAEGVVFDIDAIPLDPTPDDGFDVRTLVAGILPLRAVPMSGIEGIDAEGRRFLGVRSGTRAIFQLLVRTDVVEPGPEPQVFFLDVQFRGDGRTNLGVRRVRIVIPAITGEGCEDAGAPPVPGPSAAIVR